MKLVPVSMECCLLQFDALNFFRGPSTWESLLNFNFFNENLPISQQNRKVHGSNSLVTKFHNISDISLGIIRSENYN